MRLETSTQMWSKSQAAIAYENHIQFRPSAKAGDRATHLDIRTAWPHIPRLFGLLPTKEAYKQKEPQ